MTESQASEAQSSAQVEVGAATESGSVQAVLPEQVGTSDAEARSIVMADDGSPAATSKVLEATAPGSGHPHASNAEPASEAGVASPVEVAARVAGAEPPRMEQVGQGDAVGAVTEATEPVSPAVDVEAEAAREGTASSSPETQEPPFMAEAVLALSAAEETRPLEPSAPTAGTEAASASAPSAPLDAVMPVVETAPVAAEDNASSPSIPTPHAAGDATRTEAADIGIKEAEPVHSAPPTPVAFVPEAQHEEAPSATAPGERQNPTSTSEPLTTALAEQDTSRDAEPRAKPADTDAAPLAAASPAPEERAGTEAREASTVAPAEHERASSPPEPLNDVEAAPAVATTAPGEVSPESLSVPAEVPAGTNVPSSAPADPAATEAQSEVGPKLTALPGPGDTASEPAVVPLVAESAPRPVVPTSRAPIELDDLPASSEEPMELASTWEFVGWQGRGESNGPIGHVPETTWADRTVDLEGPAAPAAPAAPPATELPLASAWDFIQQPWQPPTGEPSEVVSSLLAAASASTETASAGPAVTAEQVLAALADVGTQGMLGKVLLAYCAGRFRRAFLLGESLGLARVGHSWGQGSDSPAVSALKVDLEAPSLLTSAEAITGPSLFSAPTHPQDEAIFSALGGEASARLLVAAVRSRGRPVAFIVADPGSEPVEPSTLDELSRVLDKASETYDRLPSTRGA
ncbi:hypothetical protein ACLESO_05565 [Pyxidicoccus sp. 3LG]